MSAKQNEVESLVTIFTIDRDVLKVLLMRKKTDPYKGYWILPGDILSLNETLEQNVSEVVDEKVGLYELPLDQGHIYSDIERDPEKRMIAVSYIGLVDSKTLELKREVREAYETEWFSILDIPKVGYDHEKIIENAIKDLKKKIVNSNVLRSLFPSDFTLPELQRVYEQILHKELDRRNFRKKFINLGLIEETGEKNEGVSGRPAKLYRFKEEVKERNLF